MKDAEATKATMLAGLAKGMTVTAACKAAQCGRTWHYRRMEIDPDYAAAVAAHKASAVGELYDRLWSEACGREEEVREVDMQETLAPDGTATGTVRKIKVRKVWHRSNIGAAAIWLRRHDPEYVERMQDGGMAPEVAAAAALAALRELEAKTTAEPDADEEPAPDEAEPTPEENTDEPDPE